MQSGDKEIKGINLVPNTRNISISYWFTFCTETLLQKLAFLVQANIFIQFSGIHNSVCHCATILKKKVISSEV